MHPDFEERLKKVYSDIPEGKLSKLNGSPENLHYQAMLMFGTKSQAMKILTKNHSLARATASPERMLEIAGAFVDERKNADARTVTKTVAVGLECEDDLHLPQELKKVTNGKQFRDNMVGLLLEPKQLEREAIAKADMIAKIESMRAGWLPEELILQVEGDLENSMAFLEALVATRPYKTVIKNVFERLRDELQTEQEKGVLGQHYQMITQQEELE